MGCGASKIAQIKINSFEKILDSYIKEKEQKEIELIKKKYEDKKQNFPDSTENQLKNNSQVINSNKQSQTQSASVQQQQQQKNSSNEQQLQINGIYAKYKKQKEDYMIEYKNLLLSKKNAKESDQHKLYAQKKKELQNFVKQFEPIQKQLLLAYPCISQFEFVNLPEIQLKDEQLIKAIVKQQSKSLNKNNQKTNQIQDQSSKINNQNKQKELNSTQDIILKEKQEQEKQSQSNKKQETMSENPIQNQQNQLNQTNKKQNNEMIENDQRKNQQINQSIKKDENKSQNQQNTQIDIC